MADFIVYAGVRFHRMQNGYYKSSRRGLLHRYVWECERGPIPPKHDVHHKLLGDKATTDPSRLELLECGPHWRAHPRSREWHAAGGRAAALVPRRRHRRTCASCGREIETISAKYCGRDECYPSHAPTGRVCVVCGQQFAARGASSTCGRSCTSVLAYRARRARVRPDSGARPRVLR
jgi:hypothetical protein